MPARCPRCGDDILTNDERRARRASYERMLAELEAARAEIVRLSHELRLVRSPRLECHVTVSLGTLKDRCDSAERDEALGRIGRARAIVRDWTHHEDCPARAHNDECGWSDDTHTTWECCGEVSTREACDAAERTECDCDHVRLWDALGGDR